MLNQNSAQRLCKILGMLGSTHAGERAAAGLAAHRLLRDLNLTWNEVIAAPSLIPSPAPAGSWQAPGTAWQKMARYCWNRRDFLRPRDQEFIRSMLNWSREPSTRQADWLAEIYARLMRQEMAR
jgi:hypothetical protein